jgi:hypothetical protein
VAVLLPYLPTPGGENHGCTDTMRKEGQMICRYWIDASHKCNKKADVWYLHDGDKIYMCNTHIEKMQLWFKDIEPHPIKKAK